MTPPTKLTAAKGGKRSKARHSRGYDSSDMEYSDADSSYSEPGGQGNHRPHKMARVPRLQRKRSKPSKYTKGDMAEYDDVHESDESVDNNDQDMIVIKHQLLSPGGGKEASPSQSSSASSVSNRRAALQHTQVAEPSLQDSHLFKGPEECVIVGTVAHRVLERIGRLDSRLLTEDEPPHDKASPKPSPLARLQRETETFGLHFTEAIDSEGGKQCERYESRAFVSLQSTAVDDSRRDVRVISGPMKGTTGKGAASSCLNCTIDVFPLIAIVSHSHCPQVSL